MFGKLMSDLTDTVAAAVNVSAAPVVMSAAVLREVIKPLGDVAAESVAVISEAIRDPHEKAR